MEPVGDSVKRELRRFGPAAGMAPVVEAWPAAVGPEIARNAWPARIARDGTLHVHTTDSIWAFELTNRAAEIAERVGVEKVKFAPGRLPDPAPEAGNTVEKRVPTPSEKHLREGERLAATIADENLRKIVARAAAMSLETGSDSRSV
jgi:hypothetical protein